MIARRGFLSGIIAAAVAPAIIRTGLLMPIKPALLGSRLGFRRFTLIDLINMDGDATARIVKILNDADESLVDLPWIEAPPGGSVVFSRGA